MIKQSKMSEAIFEKILIVVCCDNFEFSSLYVTFEEHSCRPSLCTVHVLDQRAPGNTETQEQNVGSVESCFS